MFVMSSRSTSGVGSGGCGGTGDFKNEAEEETSSTPTSVKDVTDKILSSSKIILSKVLTPTKDKVKEKVNYYPSRYSISYNSQNIV